MLIAIFLIGIAGMLSAQKIAIIDAGSSGSELYVYEWNKDNKQLIVLYSGSGKKDDTEGKILAKVDNTDAAARAYLANLTKEYSNEVGDSIPLYVLATAGMRGEADNPIYHTIKSVLEINGYKIEEAMTISGKYEGFCALLAANLENEIIKIDDSGTKLVPQDPGNPIYGILEIGGASMQIAFIKEGDNDIVNCIYRDGLGNIYSKSYLGCGVNSVYDKYINETEPYDFTTLNMGLNTVKRLIPENLAFWGLGGSIRAFFKEGKTLDEYSDFYKDSIPTATNHPYMNGKYIKYITDELNLKCVIAPLAPLAPLAHKLENPKNPSNWTDGAALDILLYGGTPDEYTGNN